MPPQRRFHFWMTYVNGKGTRYGASLDNGTGVHVRGSDAGVRVTPHGAGGNYGPGPAHTDTFVVSMTRGDGDGGEPVVLGTVASTPDGPRWEPASKACVLNDAADMLATDNHGSDRRAEVIAYLRNQARYASHSCSTCQPG